MCIIAIKKAGVKFPSEKTMTTMWYNNPDGAGFMYLHRGQVCIRKGFMKLSEFLEALGQARKEVDEVQTPFVLHFRITTHGGTKPANCHPFPVTENIALLQKPVLHTNVGVAHNGIIHIVPRNGISDTMEYIASQMSHMKRIDKKFYRNAHFLSLIEDAIDSKMAILGSDGCVATIGKFNEHEGMLYSNTSYTPRVTYGRKTTSNSYSAYSYGMYSGEEVWTAPVKKTYKALMTLDKPQFENRMVKDSHGNLYEAFDFGIDEKGRVYHISDETGGAFRKSSLGDEFEVIGSKIKFNKDKALWYDCYETVDDMYADYYGAPW